MSTAKTIFFTYALTSSPITGTSVQPYTVNKSYGHANAIHCNYIERLETSSLGNSNIGFLVPDGSLFPFLKSSNQIQSGNDGYGWNARYLYAIAQIVDGTGTTVNADPANWSVVNITNQLDGYSTFSGKTIPPSAFTNSTIINVSVSSVYNAPKYNLSYLNYPTKQVNDNDKLAFGEEAFFYGNVDTDIYAIAYTTEIPAILPLNQYNSTTNSTWDQITPLSISEMGLFNNNNDLVGIAKLNNPISKDQNIYRTILFSIDF
jgi:hypothetical protein